MHADIKPDNILMDECTVASATASAAATGLRRCRLIDLGNSLAADEARECHVRGHRTVQSLLYRAQPQIVVEAVALSENELIADCVQSDYTQEQPPLPDQQLEHKQNTMIVTRWLDALKPRERRVICSRFGLLDEEEQTLEAIGRELQCTKERVRQIQVVALQKLRRHIENEQAKGEPYATITIS